MIFEVCTDSYKGALAAEKYGAKRIELCQALEVGGLTPNYGLIQQCASGSKVEVHAMIRHKEGGFVYDDQDIEIMKKDILASKSAGAKGVVFGILDSDNHISLRNKELAEMSQELGLEITFHRAFDFAPDPVNAIKTIIGYGFDRLLTSGKEESALKGLTLIKKLQQEFGDQIQIMAGSGINAGNAVKISSSGVKNLHFTARKSNNQPVMLSMGELMLVDEEKIKSIIAMF